MARPRSGRSGPDTGSWAVRVETLSEVGLRRTRNRFLLAMAVVCALLAAALTLGAWVSYRHEAVLRRPGLPHAIATILAVNHAESKNPLLRITFRDRNGDVITVSLSGHQQPLLIGRKLEIEYNPNNPRQVRPLHNWQPGSQNLLAVAVGVALAPPIAAATVWALAACRRRRPAH